MEDIINIGSFAASTSYIVIRPITHSLTHSHHQKPQPKKEKREIKHKFDNVHISQELDYHKQSYTRR